MILDKLIEKKDILTYITARKAYLVSRMHEETVREPESRREMIRQRFIGRIRELEMVELNLRKNQMRDIAIKLWPVVKENVKEVQESEFQSDSQ